ncbi:MAG: RIO1 family regulatory kinase/ATPase [Anaerolineae bacterium]
MPHLSVDFDDNLDELEYDVRFRPDKPKKLKHDRPPVAAPPAQAGDDSPRDFNPSFTGSRHEREWIMTYLGHFYTDGVITDVLRQVKGGKEATVYCCRANPAIGVDLIAAKVYRPRMFRQLRNDAVYRQGREVIGEEGKEVRGRREKLAMHKKTDFGQTLRHTTWLANEFQTLQRLYAAGADVPKPFATGDNAILMEYVGEETFPAPALGQVRLDPRAARPLFERLMHNVELMLAHDRVHADLSAYNVLYWNGQVKIIDLPQAIDPFVNPEAFALLGRDIERLCQYFARYGVTANATQITRSLWDHYVLHPGKGAKL